ncbi:nucleolar complex protein 2 homolog [Sitophilus oryzae]|uniref:Nucleolar complex protein 2 homolog n=1 Tax=Sitophilus oryzae TaxID=7048 RepID=A0A6J2X333_SITOR|nr:nucleolar complex protein 2 homolog [Sitophilus oryzae]
MSKVKKQLAVKSKSTVLKKKLKSKTTQPKIKKTKIKVKADSDSEIEDLLNNEVLSESEENTSFQQNTDSDSDNEVDENLLTQQHKSDLEKLKKTDPEFYKFLQDNDKKLLQFSLSDEEVDESDGGEENVEDELETLHKPNENLEVASDDSDFEVEDNEKKEEHVITLKIIKKWQTDILVEKSNKTIIEVIQAFHAALKRVSSDDEESEPAKYKVEASSVFNAIIQICVIELGPSIRRYLGIQHGSKQPPHKCKKFNKIKGSLKLYLTNLLKLLLGVTSSNIQTVLLKHLHYMCPMLSSYTNLTKSILNKLIKLWSSAEDSVRVLAFFCILRIVTSQMKSTLDMCLKSMYMAYVKNSKFVSVNSLAQINFMKRSLVEMFALDLNVAYTHVFLYIRQLAIQLRNAITTNKKENVQSVYNWQYINSLHLWGILLSLTYTKQQMQQLVYPFIQVCLGTLKLIPTTQYFPLRFHVTKILINFTKDTNVFVPILPFLLEVLTSYDFDKKHQKVSMKPLNFTCLLRVSKSQIQENGFKDTVIDTVYSQLLEYLSIISHSISFPDLSLICMLQIKQFLKKCKTANYTRKMKQVLEKIEQNSQFIETERSKLTLQLTNAKQIEGWQSQIKTKGTPLSLYYETWSKMRNTKKNKEITNNDALADYKLPTLKKAKKNNTTPNETDGPVELFPSDSEESENPLEKKSKRGKRGGKNTKKRKIYQDNEDLSDTMDVKDVVKDISVDDW